MGCEAVLLGNSESRFLTTHRDIDPLSLGESLKLHLQILGVADEL